MCISNIPSWLEWLISLSLPIILLIVYYSSIQSSKKIKSKKSIAWVFVIISVIWWLYWAFTQIYSKCI